jgi:hypothetical protein
LETSEQYNDVPALSQTAECKIKTEKEHQALRPVLFNNQLSWPDYLVGLGLALAFDAVFVAEWLALETVVFVVVFAGAAFVVVVVVVVVVAVLAFDVVVTLVLVLLALPLLAALSPHAAPSAPRARTAESAIAFFIIFKDSYLSQSNPLPGVFRPLLAAIAKNSFFFVANVKI